MILLLALGLAGLQTQELAQAAPDPSAFRNGVAYTFERESATRTVDDAYDRGVITLVVNVWWPIIVNRHQVVMFSHESFGGMIYDPREPTEYIPSELP